MTKYISGTLSGLVFATAVLASFSDIMIPFMLVSAASAFYHLMKDAGKFGEWAARKVMGRVEHETATDRDPFYNAEPPRRKPRKGFL